MPGPGPWGAFCPPNLPERPCCGAGGTGAADGRGPNGLGGPPCGPCPPGPCWPGAPGPEGCRQTFARRREEYRAVADLALRHGVQALLELHHQSIVSSASAAARFLDGVDPHAVGVIHDIGNMVREGYEFDPWSLEILGEHLAHVHVKNAVLRPAPAASPPWTWEWAPMRSGAAPLQRLFDGLAGVGYEGWVSLEDFSTELPLRERLRDGLAYVQELAKR